MEFGEVFRQFDVPGLGERGFVWLALCVGTKPWQLSPC